MDAAKKKPVMIGIIVVCFGVAAFITFRGGGVKPVVIAEDATTWMKCVNLKCNGGNTVYEMSLKEYRDFQKEHSAEETTPALICSKCGKGSAFEAMKCPQCGNVFIAGESGPQDFPDRCPKCKYSALEEAKNKEQPSKSSKPSKPSKRSKPLLEE